MIGLGIAITLFSPLVAWAISPTHIACQLKKPKGISALEGCARGTIYVSQTDREAKFTSVQAAVESLYVFPLHLSPIIEGVWGRPERGDATILIGEGEYFEIVNVTRSGPLTFLGQLDLDHLDSTISPTRNLVQIWNNIFVTEPPPAEDDAQTAVLIVAPSFNASLIGSGTNGAPLQPLFGNTDFKAYNIDFSNRAANFSISQALVTDISYANASFYGCTFASYQDTWYTGRNASTYVIDSVIFGQTDWFLKLAVVRWFENVVMANRACGGGLVAWKGTDLITAPGNRYGGYVSNSKIMRSPDANATTVTDGQCFLGRPWNDLATTIYLNTFMDDSIAPIGFIPFDSARPVIMNTTFYAEFHSTGPGGNVTGRTPIEHILTAQQAKEFTLEKVFGGIPNWIDFEYIDG
ncbi:hypothetical protein Clacol_007706 [Clathrus columnatus]|uniref:pectinesterase n=1 Tax=Clathrus columnatus TaxID=1419009 RepID=A0AAV5AID6_9AGAM|nr:hypothetical protein Clacol_007706 [Clathrus columnatus]